MQKKYILYLIIYIAIIPSAQSQYYKLHLKSEKEITNALKDSLDLPVLFSEITGLHSKIDSLHQKLMRLGYIESELIKTTNENDSSYVAFFNLGHRYNKIRIDYSGSGITKKELQKLGITPDSTYFTIPITHTSYILNNLTQLKGESGHPFAKISLKNLEKTDSGQLKAKLNIHTDRTRVIDSIAIKGYEKFPKPFLKYYAGIKKGATFNHRELIRQNEKINNLGFVSATRPPEVLFRKDSTTVYLYLQKENHNHFDGILGFSTDEKTQKLQFNGYLDLRLNNNLNYGEEFSLDYKADGKEQVEFKTRLKLPLLFATRFGLDGRLRIFKKDTSYVTTEQQMRLTYRLTPLTETHLGIRKFTSNNLRDDSLTDLFIKDFNSFFITFGGNFANTQNNPLFPVRTMADIVIGAGKRSRETISDPQWSIESQIFHTFQIGPNSSFYVNNTTAYLKSETFLENELFRFGGINSIRGFQENSLEASFYTILNTEYRYLLSSEIFAHTIIDFGYFKNPTTNTGTSLSGFGLGMGINTRGGLFRIIFANGRSSGQSFDFSSSKVHISVSSRF